MSAISDFVANEKNDLAAIGDALTNIATGVTNLDAIITALQNSAGVITPEDQALLDDAQAATKAILAQVQAISTTPPGTPVPSIPPAARKH